MSKYCLKENNVTDEKLFRQRRAIIKSSIAFTFLTFSNLLYSNSRTLSFSKDLKYSTNEQTNTIKQITSYNNFYELGSGKRDPMINADKLNTGNWKVTIDGEVENKFVLDTEDIINKFPLEERIYRLRCVEAWSMVVPWIGFELNQLIKLAKPTHKAKYISLKKNDILHLDQVHNGINSKVYKLRLKKNKSLILKMYPFEDNLKRTRPKFGK